MTREGREDPFLDWKVRIFFSGAILLIAGMVLEVRLLAGLAIAVLAVGVVLVMIQRGRDRHIPRAPED